MDRFSKLCRLCMVKEENLGDGKLWDLYEKNNEEVREQIYNCTSILVMKDGLPTGICTNCLSTINNFHAFLDMVKHSQIALKKIYYRHEELFSGKNNDDQNGYLSQLSNEIKDLKGQYIKVDNKCPNRVKGKRDINCKDSVPAQKVKEKIYINVNDRVFSPKAAQQETSNRSAANYKTIKPTQSRNSIPRKCKSETCSGSEKRMKLQEDGRDDNKITELKQPASLIESNYSLLDDESGLGSDSQNYLENSRNKKTCPKTNSNDSLKPHLSKTINTSSSEYSQYTDRSRQTQNVESKTSDADQRNFRSSLNDYHEDDYKSSNLDCGSNLPESKHKNDKEDILHKSVSVVTISDDMASDKINSKRNKLPESVDKIKHENWNNNKKLDDPYKCEICNKTFDQFFDYQDHQYTHDGEYVFRCSECSQVFNNRDELVEHEKNHKVECNICNVEMKPKSIPAHTLRHTEKHKCPECKKQFSSNAILKKHIEALHLGIKGCVCYICGKQTSTQSSLKRHLIKHTNERPYPCQFCDFSAKSLNVMKIHVARSHLSAPTFCCECNKLFKSKLSLQQHIKRFHNGAKQFICDVCGKSFNERYNLLKHAKRHIGQLLYECKVCNKDFFTTRQLRQHMFIHKKSGMSCPNCGKDFIYKKYFDKHVLSCKICIKKTNDV